MALLSILALGGALLAAADDEPEDPNEKLKMAVVDGVTTVVNGSPAYRIYYGIYNQVGGVQKKTKGGEGYVPTSQFDALNVETVSIPASFAGLEAEMVPTRLEEQLFRIVEVTETEDYVEVRARHVWYDNLKNFTTWVPTAETDYTAASVCRNVMENAISAVPSRVASDCKDTKKGSAFDYRNKNLVECFLDPENGICAKFGLSLIRNNWDFYCLKSVGYNRGYVVENGKNLLGVERNESIENLVTRVAAFGHAANGDIVWLNNSGKKYVDSQYINDYSCPHMELLDTGITIGKDGTTSENIQQKLLAAAQARFGVDHVDLPEVQMTIEFLSLGDTEEYAQYRGLDKVYLYDIISVKDTVRGYSYTAQVIEVEHDVLTGMLLSVTIGKLDNWDGTRKIATWQVPEIDGENIRLKSILAGSFAPGAIQASDLYGVINADTINANSINAINAKLGTATIENGYINNADITIAKIKDLSAESFIAQDAVTDRYYIKKLAVDNAQFVQAAVGELIVKASDNHYYRMDVNAQGGITTTDVTSTLSSGEIAAGMTTDGKCTIIETDLTVTDLAASNIKGMNALIDKLTASRIDVDELFARTAFIGKLNTTDISGNSSLQLYVANNAYGIKNGVAITDNGVEISAGKYVKIKSGTAGVDPGKLIVETGNFTIDASGNVTMSGTVTAGSGSVIGGWTLGANTFYSGTSTGYVALDSNTSNTYAMWAGNETASSAPFRVKRSGEVTLTKLLALGSDGVTEEEVNLRTAGLWKLSYHTVKSTTSDSGYCTSITLSNNKTLNFRHATTVSLSGSWSGSTFTVSDTGGSGESLSETLAAGTGTGNQTSGGQNTIDTFDSSHKAYGYVNAERLGSGNGRLYTFNVDASGEYSAGQTAAGLSISGAVISRALTSSTKSYTITASIGTWSDGSATVSAKAGAITLATATATIPSLTLTAGGWSGGSNTVTAKHQSSSSLGSTTVSIPSVTSCTIGSLQTGHTYNVSVAIGGTTKPSTINATTVYDTGWLDGYAAAVGVVGVNNNVITVPASSSTSGTTASSSYTITAAIQLNTNSPAYGYAHADATAYAQIDGTGVDTAYRQNNWKTI